jgi:TonB family protein
MNRRQALNTFCLMVSLTGVLSASGRRVQRVVSMEYPDLAIQARMQGRIVVECIVDAEGEVTFAKVIRSEGMTDQGRSILGEAVVENVKQWRFQTTSDTDAPSVQIEYKFTLEKEAKRKRATRFVFEFPNLVYVTSPYMTAMY